VFGVYTVIKVYTPVTVVGVGFNLFVFGEFRLRVEGELSNAIAWGAYDLWKIFHKESCDGQDSGIGVKDVAGVGLLENKGI
jgi:hypothetical protein